MASSSVAIADDDPVTVEVDSKINVRSWAQAPGDTRRPDEITLVFTGDTLIHSSLVNAARVRGGYDFRPMFSGVRHLIAQADLAICHLEVPLSPTSSSLSSYPLFNAPREVADALVWAGYDGCSTASNHSIDKGVPGIGGTLEVLDRAGLVHSGMAAEPTDGWEAAMYELDGVTVANISATYWLIGNFLSGMHSDPRTSDGVIVHANAVNTGAGWRFDSIDVTPTDVTSRGWRIFLPEPGSASYNRTMGVVSSMRAPFGLYESPGLSPADLALIE